jgi:hypothetical protein
MDGTFFEAMHFKSCWQYLNPNLLRGHSAFILHRLAKYNSNLTDINTLVSCKGKVRLSLCCIKHSTKTYRGSRGTTPCILYLSNRWVQVSCQHYLWCNSPNGQETGRSPERAWIKTLKIPVPDGNLTLVLVHSQPPYWLSQSEKQCETKATEPTRCRPLLRFSWAFPYFSNNNTIFVLQKDIL